MLQCSLRFSFAFSHCFWTLVLASAPTSCLPCVFPPQYAVLVMGCLALAARLVQWLAPWSLSPSARVLSTKLDQVLCILCHFQEHSWFWSREKGHFCTVDPGWSTGPIVIANTFFLSCSPFVMCQQSWPTSQPKTSVSESHPALLRRSIGCSRSTLASMHHMRARCGRFDSISQAWLGVWVRGRPQLPQPARLVWSGMAGADRLMDWSVSRAECAERLAFGAGEAMKTHPKKSLRSPKVPDEGREGKQVWATEG